MTHDDLQRPVRGIPENTRENPGIFGFYPAQRPQGGDLFLFTHLLVEVSVLFIYLFII